MVQKLLEHIPKVRITVRKYDFYYYDCSLQQMNLRFTIYDLRLVLRSRLLCVLVADASYSVLREAQKRVQLKKPIN